MSRQRRRPGPARAPRRAVRSRYGTAQARQRRRLGEAGRTRSLSNPCRVPGTSASSGDAPWNEHDPDASAAKSTDHPTVSWGTEIGSHMPQRWRPPAGLATAEGGVFPAGAGETRIDQGQEVAAIKSLEESEWRAPGRFERTVPDQPASLQARLTQRESRRAMGLPISRGDAQLSGEVGGPTEVAAVGSVREASRHAAQTRRRHCELLPDEGSLRSRGSGEREHPYVDQPRPGV